MPKIPSERRLILFGRYPVPGRTKTRLMPLLGRLGAAELHRCLTQQMLSVLLRSYQAPVEMAYTDADRDQVSRWLGGLRIPVHAQPEGDLGRRMAYVIRHAFDRGAQQVVLVGTDVPGITSRHIVDAFDALAEYDVVLGPSHDGGYWLIGCRRPAPVFDGIDWGTVRVLDQTIRAAERCGLSTALLERLLDIDTEADLHRWQPEREWGKPYLSVVVPTLNEADRIAPLVESLRAIDVETIVADGGSRDGTVQAAREAGAEVISAPPGRAIQQNAGAARAAGKVLMFLHADTRLPENFGAQVFERLMDPKVVLGAFRFKSDWDHWRMRWIERGVRARCALLHLPYGDQALFMRKKIFEQAGGFSDVPFAEDLLLVRKLARRGKIELTPGAVVTSGRRWRAVGVCRMTLINFLVACGCLLGIPPQRLALVRRYGLKVKRRADSEHDDDA